MLVHYEETRNDNEKNWKKKEALWINGYVYKEKEKGFYLYICKKKMCIKGFCVCKRCVKRNSCVCEQRVYIKELLYEPQVCVGTQYFDRIWYWDMNFYFNCMMLYYILLHCLTKKNYKLWRFCSKPNTFLINFIWL